MYTVVYYNYMDTNMTTLSLEDVQAAARPGHDCTEACRTQANTECGCGASPTECDECALFFTDHPFAL